MAKDMAGRLVMDRRGFIGGTLAASALAALAGCSGQTSDTGSADAGSASSGGENVMSVYSSEPAYIDPYNAMEVQGTMVVYACFDTLVTWDWDTGEAVPLAAADLPAVSEDGLTYTFTLREGMTFHNGDPVDAASFKRGWERLADPTMATPSSIGYHLEPVAGYSEMQAGEADEISGLVAVDDLTFQVTLNAPMADFLAVCCHPGLSPVPQAALDDPATFLEQPIGNGPFQLDEAWQHNQYITCSRFEDYYGDAPALDGIYYAIHNSPDTAFNEFEAGNLDFAQIPSGRIQQTIDEYGESDDGYTVTPGKQVLTGSQVSTYFIVLNTQDELLSNVDIRHAISLAINRQNIVDSLFEGTREVADTIFPRAIDDDEEDLWEYSTYDPERAGQILDEAGYPLGDDGTRGLSVTLSYDTGRGHEDIMSSIQADLQEIGIEVAQDTAEWAVHLTKMREGSFQMGRSGWTADYPTMDNFLYPNFYSTASDNYSHYANAEVDAAIDAARQIADDTERRAAYRTICHTIGEDLPVIPIMYYAHNYVGSDRVQQFYYDAQQHPDFITAELA